MDIFEHVGKRIQEFRTGAALSQEGLAKELGVATNTISRWETGTYKPDLKDLDSMARFFKVSITEFLPKEMVPSNDPVNALLRTAKQLDPSDLEELQRYAEFRKAKHLLKDATRARPGRKRKDA